MKEAADILVVDDDELTRELLSLHLASAGYSVTTLEDAVVALQRLVRRRPKLIIVDIQMPYMDGLEFVRALKAEPSFRDIPILVVTARDGEQEAAKTAGAIACLKKPVVANDLLSIVRSVFPPDP